MTKLGIIQIDVHFFKAPPVNQTSKPFERFYVFNNNIFNLKFRTKKNHLRIFQLVASRIKQDVKKTFDS